MVERVRPPVRKSISTQQTVPPQYASRTLAAMMNGHSSATNGCRGTDVSGRVVSATSATATTGSQRMHHRSLSSTGAHRSVDDSLLGLTSPMSAATLDAFEQYLAALRLADEAGDSHAVTEDSAVAASGSSKRTADKDARPVRPTVTRRSQSETNTSSSKNVSSLSPGTATALAVTTSGSSGRRRRSETARFSEDADGLASIKDALDQILVERQFRRKSQRRLPADESYIRRGWRSQYPTAARSNGEARLTRGHTIAIDATRSDATKSGSDLRATLGMQPAAQQPFHSASASLTTFEPAVQTAGDTGSVSTGRSIHSTSTDEQQAIWTADELRQRKPERYRSLPTDQPMPGAAPERDSAAQPSATEGDAIQRRRPWSSGGQAMMVATHPGDSASSALMRRSQDIADFDINQPGRENAETRAYQRRPSLGSVLPHHSWADGHVPPQIPGQENAHVNSVPQSSKRSATSLHRHASSTSSTIMAPATTMFTAISGSNADDAIYRSPSGNARRANTDHHQQQQQQQQPSGGIIGAPAPGYSFSAPNMMTQTVADLMPMCSMSGMLASFYRGTGVLARLRQWKSRYYMLKDHTLYRFKGRELDNTVIDMLKLHPSSVVCVSDKFPGKQYCIKIVGAVSSLTPTSASNAASAGVASPTAVQQNSRYGSSGQSSVWESSRWYVQASNADDLSLWLAKLKAAVVRAKYATRALPLPPNAAPPASTPGIGHVVPWIASASTGNGNAVTLMDHSAANAPPVRRASETAVASPPISGSALPGSSASPGDWGDGSMRRTARAQKSQSMVAAVSSGQSAGGSSRQLRMTIPPPPPPPLPPAAHYATHPGYTQQSDAMPGQSPQTPATEHAHPANTPSVRRRATGDYFSGAHISNGNSNRSSRSSSGSANSHGSYVVVTRSGSSAPVAVADPRGYYTSPPHSHSHYPHASPSATTNLVGAPGRHPPPQSPLPAVPQPSYFQPQYPANSTAFYAHSTAPDTYPDQRMGRMDSSRMLDPYQMHMHSAMSSVPIPANDAALSVELHRRQRSIGSASGGSGFSSSSPRSSNGLAVTTPTGENVPVVPYGRRPSLAPVREDR